MMEESQAALASGAKKRRERSIRALRKMRIEDVIKIHKAMAFMGSLIVVGTVVMLVLGHADIVDPAHLAVVVPILDSILILIWMLCHWVLQTCDEPEPPQSEKPPGLDFLLPYIIVICGCILYGAGLFVVIARGDPEESTLVGPFVITAVGVSITKAAWRPCAATIIVLGVMIIVWAEEFSDLAFGTIVWLTRLLMAMVPYYIYRATWFDGTEAAEKVSSEADSRSIWGGGEAA